VILQKALWINLQEQNKHNEKSYACLFLFITHFFSANTIKQKNDNSSVHLDFYQLSIQDYTILVNIEVVQNKVH